MQKCNAAETALQFAFASLHSRFFKYAAVVCRLGRLEEKYEDTECKIGTLQARLAERERDLLQTQRERTDLKGTLASTEGELRATKVEADHEIRRLQEKVCSLCRRRGLKNDCVDKLAL